MKLFFATSNKGKLPSVNRVLNRFGIEVEQYDADIPELQAERAGQIAAEKARWAFGRLGKPVMVVDSAFHIGVLNGFPGPNVKWATKQLGLDGYLRLLSPFTDERDRSCYFEDAIACMTGDFSEPQIFLRLAHGRLSLDERGAVSEQEKSPLWRLFIPSGGDKTLGEMTPEELLRHRSDPEIEQPYTELAHWLVSLRSERGMP